MVKEQDKFKNVEEYNRYRTKINSLVEVENNKIKEEYKDTIEHLEKQGCLKSYLREWILIKVVEKLIVERGDLKNGN